MRSKSYAVLMLTLFLASVLTLTFNVQPSVAEPSVITIDGDMGDWAGILPVATDLAGDTFPWSSNVTIVGHPNSTTRESPEQVPINDRVRDLTAFYVMPQDPNWVYFRIDFNDIYPDFSYPYGNASVWAIYFDFDQVDGSGGTDPAMVADYVFPSTMAWECFLQGDEEGVILVFSDWSTFAEANKTYNDNIYYAYNYAVDAVEVAVNRTLLENTNGGNPLGKTGVTVTTHKPGESWGIWGNFLHAFDPQAPGLSGEHWGWDAEAYDAWDSPKKPSCAGGHPKDIDHVSGLPIISGPTPAQAAATPPDFPPPLGQGYVTGVPPGMPAAFTGPWNGDPKAADIADILSGGPGALTPCSDEWWDRNDEINSNGYFQVDMSTTGTPFDPIARFIYSPLFPPVNGILTFNASASMPGWNGSAYVPIANYTWDFGDGNVTTVTDPVVYHAYATAGDYTVNLTVRCEDDSVLITAGLTSDSTWRDITIRPLKPVVSFTYSPYKPMAGELVILDASASLPGWNGTDYVPIVNYTWDFDDGSRVMESDPVTTHRFTAESNYTVTLNVTDRERHWNTKSKVITVLPPPPPYPRARFTYSPAFPLPNKTVTFDASSSLLGWNGTDYVAIANYSWDFGDGTPVVTEADPVTTHNYTTVGTYTVTLNITDTRGFWNTTSRTITVTVMTRPPQVLIFEDDFESYNVGTFPSAGGWRLWWLGKGREYQKIVDIVSFSPTKSLQTLGRGIEGGSHMAAVIAYPFSWSSSIIGYRVYVRVDEVCTFANSAGFGFGKKTNVGTASGSKVGFYSDSMIKANVAGVGLIPLQSYEADRWYKIEVVLDTITDTFSVWIDDELKGQGFNSTLSSSQITALIIASGYPNVKVYYDNVRLYESKSSPTANFTYSPSILHVNQTVTFDASSSLPGWNGTQDTTVVNYTWNFGDGNVTVAMAPIITHKYTVGDTYTVILNVTDNQGLWDITSKPVTISTPPPPYGPYADFSHSLSTYVYEEIVFNASASEPGWTGSEVAPIVNYAWDFGDGSSGTGMITKHVYTAVGTYAVTLNVTDTQGFWNIWSETIYIRRVPTVYVNPATITATSVGQNFTVEICIADVVDLYLFCCGMTWDPDALECVYVKDGPFLTEGADPKYDYINISDPNWINNTAGELYPPYAISLTWIGSEKGMNGTGSGTLFIAKFTAKKTGTFNVHPAEVYLLDSEGIRISAIVRDVFTVVQGENVYPIVTVNNLIANNFPSGRIRVYNYNFSETVKAIGFEITGDPGKAGFCNVTIPVGLLGDTPEGDWLILIDGSEVPATITHNATHTFIYFTYTLSTHNVKIKVKPTADFTFTPLVSVINQNVTFNASASTPSEDIISYAWDFGDGSKVTEADPVTSHNYTAAGTYTVTLNATDSEGFWTTMSKTITIYASPFHDIIVTNITPYNSHQHCVVYEAYPTWVVPLEIYVSVKNNGTFTETFTVTLYWNNTNVMGTETVTLAPGETKNITLTWDIPDIPFAWPYPIYILSANATLPGDINPADNTRTDGAITIKWPGDVNGDGHINVEDLWWFAKAWGRRVGDLRYDPMMDFDGDGRILSMDLFILARNWYHGPLD